MDLMQMAGHLSLEFDAVVVGPWERPTQDMVIITKADGCGVALMMGPGKALALESVPGGLDVWQVRERPGGQGLYDMSNARSVIRYNTDLDGAREALREAGPAVWETPPPSAVNEPCPTCGK